MKLSKFIGIGLIQLPTIFLTVWTVWICKSATDMPMVLVVFLSGLVSVVYGTIAASLIDGSIEF